ncbi:MAG: Uncharacterized protein LiPW41_572 [Parcubacteria group bacterium LiPW_41]|nr:MAG: Uncharacterized protein LiPW41_572 [Parcubacteria group bacterium LiPW_41]
MKKIIYSIFSIALISTLFYLGTSVIKAQIQKNDFQFPIAELGNCENENACKNYCDNPNNMSACIDFSVSKGLVSANEAAIGKKAIEKIKKGETPGGCKDKESCEKFCQNNTRDLQQCIAFAEEIGVPQEEIAQAKQIASALQKGAQLPGGCKGKQSCEAYCTDTVHIDECLSFAEIAQIIPAEEIAEAKKVAPFLKNGETPGKCKGKEECQNYCIDENHFDECLTFAEKAQLIPKEEIDLARKTGGKGPGGCKSKEACEAFCEIEENAKGCADFALEKQLISEDEAKMMVGGAGKIREGLEKIPPEMKGEVESCLNTIFNGELSKVMGNGKTITKGQGEKIGSCFESAAQNYAGKQQGGATSGGNIMQPPSKEQIENMMKGAPDSVKQEIQKNIEQKYKEEFEKNIPKNIPSGMMPRLPSNNTQIPDLEEIEKQIPKSAPQGAPCNSEAECRAMFGGGPPVGIPQ